MLALRHRPSAGTGIVSVMTGHSALSNLIHSFAEYVCGNLEEVRLTVLGLRSNQCVHYTVRGNDQHRVRGVRIHDPTSVQYAVFGPWVQPAYAH